MSYNLTVKEAKTLIVMASEALSKRHYSEVCDAVGVSSKTQQRWYKKSEKEPESLSSMPYPNYLQLKAIIGQSVLKPVKHEVEIPSQYIMTAQNYQCPPLSFLTQLVGINGMLKMTRSDIANLLMISSKDLSDKIAKEKLSFTRWSLLLLLAGVEAKEIFK